MKIQVIGTGCHKCNSLAEVTDQAVKELGISAEISKVTDLKKIMELGVMITPALAVDGVVKIAGRVPSLTEAKSLLSSRATG